MKKYKIFNKIGLAICLTLGLVAGIGLFTHR